MPRDARLSHGDIVTYDATGDRRGFDVPLDRIAGPYLDRLVGDLPGPEDWDRIDRQRSVLDDEHGAGM